MIQAYLSDYSSQLRRIERTKKSYYHDEPVREDEYLKTAVLTALAAKDDKPYERKSKGGLNF
jgi:hypothetical protein